jgi:hypothetical protein
VLFVTQFLLFVQSIQEFDKYVIGSIERRYAGKTYSRQSEKSLIGTEML